MDMGHMGRGSAALLDCCDGVYLPVLEDPVSRAKLQAVSCREKSAVWISFSGERWEILSGLF